MERKENCASCKHFGKDDKRCHRYPPQITPYARELEYREIHCVPEFPYVVETDWCGEFVKHEPESTTETTEKREERTCDGCKSYGSCMKVCSMWWPKDKSCSACVHFDEGQPDHFCTPCKAASNFELKEG